jgi:hypothetical protein
LFQRRIVHGCRLELFEHGLRHSRDHIETILTVDTVATFDPLIHVQGIPSKFTLHGHAVQECLQ